MDDLRREAEALQDRGVWDAEALAVNEAILSADPGDQTATVRRARCLRALGRLDEAVAGLQRLVADHPENAVAKSQLTKIRRRLDARTRAEALIAVDRSELFDAAERAKAARRDHDFQIEARRLLARRERTPAAACALAAAQRAGGELDAALVTYRWAWAQDDSPRTNPMAYVGLAALLRELDRLGEAEKLLRGVLAVDPRDSYARRTLAAVLMDRAERRGDVGRLDEAKRLLDAEWRTTARDQELKAAYGRLRGLS